MKGYEDILRRRRPASCHPPMSLDNRAKIFAPFSALRGFEIGILTEEKNKVLVPRATPSEDLQEEMDRLLAGLSRGDQVCVVWFRRERKTGDLELGTYRRESDVVLGVDPAGRVLRLFGRDIPLEDIRALERVQP